MVVIFCRADYSPSRSLKYRVYFAAMKSVDKKQMVHMRIDARLLKRLDDFRFKHRFESRTEAACWLMKVALEKKPVPAAERKD